MKIRIGFKDSPAHSIEIADFEKIIIGNRFFTAEEIKIQAIPLNKKEFFTVVGQNDCLVVNSSEVAYIHLS